MPTNSSTFTIGTSMGTSMKLHASLLVAVLLAAMMPVIGAAPASASTTTARSLLSRLAVKAESGNSSYKRTYFKLWTDANRDCQNTRTEVLIGESKVTPRYTASRHCAVATGTWYSYYDGRTWTRPADVDIDHMVPLKEAWGSGARLWSASKRASYANDLGSYATLIAVTDNVNQSKGDKDPAQWLPPRKAARCTYAIQWVQVKYRWRLSIDSAERSRLSSILSGRCGSRSVAVPPVVSTGSTPPVVQPAPRPAPRPAPAPPAVSVYYANCTAVRAAGAAPIHRGEAGYSTKLDRDGDGIGCE